MTDPNAPKATDAPIPATRDEMARTIYKVMYGEEMTWTPKPNGNSMRVAVYVESLLTARESAIHAEMLERCAKVCADEAEHLRKALGPSDRAMCVATANTIRALIRSMADEVKS